MLDVGLTKPQVGPLLRLLHASRLSLVVTQIDDETCFAHCSERGLSCHGSSHLHALWILLRAIESREEEPQHS